MKSFEGVKTNLKKAKKSRLNRILPTTYLLRDYIYIYIYIYNRPIGLMD